MHTLYKKYTILDSKSKKGIFLDYVEGTKYYYLYKVKNDSIIKNHFVNFVKCENNKHRKETFKVSNKKSLEIIFIIETIDSTSNFKSKSKNLVEDFDNFSGQEFLTLKYLFLVKEI